MSSYIGVPSVPRDSTIASSMIVQDYISKHFKGEKAIASRFKPKGVDSCFGNFPRQYKRPDQWDGNPTLRRNCRTSYTSPMRLSKANRPRGPDVREISETISGVGLRPTTADPSCRRSCFNCSSGGVVGDARSGSGEGAGVYGPEEAATAAATNRQDGEGLRATPTRAPRPKTASAVRTSSPTTLSVQGATVATRKYLLTQGKFRITPSKLMASLQVARENNTRPLSAPARVRRRRPPAPPKAGAWRRRAIPATVFRNYYVRGDLPICVDHRANGNGIRWKIRPSDLDFHVYLPIFFDGLREVEDPYRFLATQGTLDVIEAAPDKVLPVIPQLILPTKIALNTREPRIICPTLKILQQMILLCPVIGQALVPYYRQLLPVFNLFRGKNHNMGDAIDYNQRSRTNVGELIMETLEVMEQFGGPDAFINIKYMVPTYESCAV